MEPVSILIDGREFIPGGMTGIGRVLVGLVDALVESAVVSKIILLVSSYEAVPSTLMENGKIHIKIISGSFFKVEMIISKLSKSNVSLFISPYPKLPLLGCYCKSIHIIHDVLDLTHPAYRKRLRTILDKFRVKLALKSSSLTWYVSQWSYRETKKYLGFAGNNYKIRYNAINETFVPEKEKSDSEILLNYKLSPGYLLIVGNGLPHKNLGVLLEVSSLIKRQLVFVGVKKERQKYWESQYPHASAIWIPHLADKELPAIFRGAFCIAQPSTEEGYGYPPLEAMACGVPAVVSNIPVLIETTRNCALTADPSNPQTWIGSFLKLEDKNLSQSIVEKGLIWVDALRGRKGWQKHICDIEELLKVK